MPIGTVSQLIRSYYRFTIEGCSALPLIPSQGHMHLTQMQIKKSCTVILEAYESVRQWNTEIRMVLDAEELQSYLHSAFDHFARSLDHLFDFVEASFSNSPILLNFGGNILELALNVMRVGKTRIEIEAIFQELSYMVASCIMLDSARKKNPGKSLALESCNMFKLTQD
jgi:hypothetical protein